MGSSVQRGALAALLDRPGSSLVEGIDDGLFLLMIEGIGLAKHHILEYLRLCFGHESEVSKFGQFSRRAALIGRWSGKFYAASRDFS